MLEIVFKLADDNGWLLLDIDDLRTLVTHVADNRKEISSRYGLVSAPSIAAIQRALLQLGQQGGDAFFGEPALELADLMRTTPDGRGVISILAADQLILKPRLYSSFLLWLLSELFETLPEVGDLDKPKLVFVFDEAHLLFDDAPPALQQRIEQVVRLIRSKGVGVYFCSQFPDDVPDNILGQLGNRVQHALRAFTPRDQKAVKTAAETFVPNPSLDVAKTISQLGVGEALVSMLMDKGVPMPVERTLVAPPRSRMGAITEAERARVRAGSAVGAKYDAAVDRESAAEMLAARHADAVPTPAPRETPPSPAATGRQWIRTDHARRDARHQPPPGRGRIDGQAGGANDGQPGRTPDPARRARRHLRQTSLSGLGTLAPSRGEKHRARHPGGACAAESRTRRPVAHSSP